MESTDDSEKNFFKYVFNFDDSSKSDMLNIIQYTLIAIIPVVMLNKSMQKYVPESDDKKGSLELLAEIIIQIVGMFIGLLLIHRVITFVPTYSGMNYPDFNIVFIILAVLMITLSLQTKLGEKVSILFDRVVELWDGKSESNDKKKKGKKGSGNVKVSQPISQGQDAQMVSLYSGGGGSGMGQGGTTSISSLPTESAGQQQPDYNSMYQNNNTSMPGAASPGMEGMGQGMIMAANEVLGGSGFGSAW